VRRAALAATVLLVLVTPWVPPADSDFLASGVVNASNRVLTVGGPAVAANASWTVVAWNENASFRAWDVHYRIRVDDGPWGRARNLTATATNSWLPALAFSAGALHALWIEDVSSARLPEVRTAHTRDGENWTAPTVLGEGVILRPALVAGPEESLHAVWAAGDRVWYARWNGARWFPPEPASGSPREGAFLSVALALDREQRPLVAWTWKPVVRSSEPVETPEEAARVETAVRLATGWETPFLLSNPQRGSATDPSLWRANNGTLYVAFHQVLTRGVVLWAVRETDQWTVPHVIEGTHGSGTYPRIAVGGGTVRIAFVHRTNGSAAVLAEERGNSWVSETLAYSDNPLGVGFIDHIRDAQGRSRVVWTYQPPNRSVDVFYYERAHDALVVDTSPPTIADVRPSPGSFLNSSTVRIEVLYLKIGTMDASSLRLLVDDVPVTNATVQDGRVAAEVRGLAEGPHTVDFSFADFSGNRIERTWTFHVDVTPPSTNLVLEPPLSAGQWHRGGVQLTWQGLDPGEGASGYAGVATTLYRNGQRAFASQLAPGTHALSQLASRFAFPLEGHFVLLYAGTDAAGNAEAPRNVTFQVDSIAPTSRVLPLPAVSNAAELAVEVSATDQGAGIERLELWGRDMDARAQLPSDWRLLQAFASAEGAHRLASPDGRLWEFYTVARDRAGNAESAPPAARASLVVDRTAPSVRVMQPGDGSTISTTTSVIVDASDAVSGVTRVRFLLDGNAFANATSPPYVAAIDPREVPAGDHVVTVEALDAAGNVGSVAFRLTTVGGRPRDNATTPPGGSFLPGFDVLVAVGGLVLVATVLRRKIGQP